MLLSENIIPHITIPTRITENSMTLIDTILVRMDINNIDTRCISGNLISNCEHCSTIGFNRQLITTLVYNIKSVTKPGTLSPIGI